MPTREKPDFLGFTAKITDSNHRNERATPGKPSLWAKAAAPSRNQAVETNRLELPGYRDRGSLPFTGCNTAAIRLGLGWDWAGIGLGLGSTSAQRRAHAAMRAPKTHNAATAPTLPMGVRANRWLRCPVSPTQNG